MWHRLEHTVVLAVAIELAMVIAFNAIMLRPRWTFEAFRTDGERRPLPADGLELVSTEPTIPGEPPVRFFVLELR